MSEGSSQEQRLVEIADDIVQTTTDLTEALQALEAWHQGLEHVLQEFRLQQPIALKDTHSLSSELRGVAELLRSSPAAWAERWAELKPAQALAGAFEGRVMLLVFGKFNAGKSSLCNLLADRFRAHGRAVSVFQLDQGRITESGQSFQEGATETTSRLQGVCLGQGLVLLDTPGLHSMTEDNAELTLRFTDSADGMLWLSSSTSPGQVQELDELGRELHRHKPLLPVITRSDVFEEDEVDGDIVKRLRNKSPANRRLQEDDVQQRAQGKLLQMGVETSLLKPPVSISVRAAREEDLTRQALHDSGLDRLYGAIVELVEPAIAYKRRKPAEMLLHHLEENVAGVVTSRILPALASLVDQLQAEQQRLHALQIRVASQVRRQVASAIAAVLERHASADEVPHACEELDRLLDEALARELALHLGDYDVTRTRETALLSVDAKGEFDFEKLHDELQAAVHALIAQRVDSVFAPLLQGLIDLQDAGDALQDELVRQRTLLAQAKALLRSPRNVAETAG